MRLQLPPVLRAYAAGHAELDLPGDTLGDALRELFRRHPALRERVLDRKGGVFPYLVLFRNGEALPRAGLLDTPVAPADEVEIVAAAEGG